MRETRQEMLKRHSDWLEAHPFWSWGIAIWVTLAVFDVAEGLRWLANQ